MRSLIFLLVLCCSSVACGSTVWDITFDNGATEIMATIDSDANTMVITSFTSSDASLIDPVVPLTLVAREHTGNNSLVPTAWDMPVYTDINDLLSDIDSTGVGFMVPGNNSDEAWITDVGQSVSPFFAVGWGLHGANIGLGSETYNNGFSNNFFRWPWGSNSNLAISYPASNVTAVAVPEPASVLLALFAFAGVYGWIRREGL